MPWEYSQSTGTLKHNGEVKGKGYAGKGKGKNNPDMQDVKNVGPIPQGRYRISPPRDSKKTGPHVMDLQPEGHDAKGRTSFQMHGDSKSHPGKASDGCIVMPRSVRDEVAKSGDNVIDVVK